MAQTIKVYSPNKVWDEPFAPWGIASGKDGSIYVADRDGHSIKRIYEDGTMETVAGIGDIGYSDVTHLPHVSHPARFNSPAQITVDQFGMIYVADSGNHRIRRIDHAGVVTTVAGTGFGGHRDGDGDDAEFQFPFGITADGEGNVYVADYGNHCIRKITSGGEVTTLAGVAGVTGHEDGSADAALFNNPIDVAVDNEGCVYVADSGNFRIRKITNMGVFRKSPVPMVSTIAGSGAKGTSDGPNCVAEFEAPCGLDIDSGTNIFVTDGNRLRRIDARSSVVSTIDVELDMSEGRDILRSGGTPDEPSLGGPSAIVVDSTGNLIVAEYLRGSVRLLSCRECLPAVEHRTTLTYQASVRRRIARDMTAKAHNVKQKYDFEVGVAEEAVRQAKIRLAKIQAKQQKAVTAASEEAEKANAAFAAADDALTTFREQVMNEGLEMLSISETYELLRALDVTNITMSALESQKIDGKALAALNECDYQELLAIRWLGDRRRLWTTLRLLGRKEDSESRAHVRRHAVRAWNSSRVAIWLMEKGYSTLAPAFVENKIDGPVLLQLELDDLTVLGVKSSVRVELMSEIHTLWDNPQQEPVRNLLGPEPEISWRPDQKGGEQSLELLFDDLGTRIPDPLSPSKFTSDLLEADELETQSDTHRSSLPGESKYIFNVLFELPFEHVGPEEVSKSVTLTDPSNSVHVLATVNRVDPFNQPVSDGSIHSSGNEGYKILATQGTPPEAPPLAADREVAKQADVPNFDQGPRDASLQIVSQTNDMPAAARIEAPKNIDVLSPNVQPASIENTVSTEVHVMLRDSSTASKEVMQELPSSQEKRNVTENTQSDGIITSYVAEESEFETISSKSTSRLVETLPVAGSANLSTEWSRSPEAQSIAGDAQSDVLSVSNDAGEGVFETFSSGPVALDDLRTPSKVSSGKMAVNVVPQGANLVPENCENEKTNENNPSEGNLTEGLVALSNVVLRQLSQITVDNSEYFHDGPESSPQKHHSAFTNDDMLLNTFAESSYQTPPRTLATRGNWVDDSGFINDVSSEISTSSDEVEFLDGSDSAVLGVSKLDITLSDESLPATPERCSKQENKPPPQNQDLYISSSFIKFEDPETPPRPKLESPSKAGWGTPPHIKSISKLHNRRSIGEMPQSQEHRLMGGIPLDQSTPKKSVGTQPKSNEEPNISPSQRIKFKRKPFAGNKFKAETTTADKQNENKGKRQFTML